MKRTFAAFAFAVTTCGAAFSARDARADLPIDIEVGPRVGIATDPGVGVVNPLGLGVGARAGVIFRKIYLGGTITYYFGNRTHDSATLTSSTALQTGFEAGYDFTLWILTIRPQLGIGNITFNYQEETATPTQGAKGFSNSGGSLYLEPGVVGLVSFGLLYVGADVNMLAIPSTAPGGAAGFGRGSRASDFAAAFTTHAQVGVRF